MKTAFSLDKKTPTHIELQHTCLDPVEYRFKLKLDVLEYRFLYNLATPLLCNIFVLRAGATHTVAETRGHTMDTLALPTIKSRLVITVLPN